VKEKRLKTLSEYRERWCRCYVWLIIKDCSRSWWRKLEKPVCQQWRGWMAVQQVGWRKLTKVCQDGTSVTRDKYDKKLQNEIKKQNYTHKSKY